MVDCCDHAGGRVVITIGNKQWSTRGGVSIMPSRFSRAAGANDDGSIYVMTKPEPAEADMTFTDKCDLNIEDITEGCRLDVTFDLIDMRKRILFSQANVVGRPMFKTDDGSITGLKIVSSQVTQQRY